MTQVVRNAGKEQIFGERSEEIHKKRTTGQIKLISHIHKYEKSLNISA